MPSNQTAYRYASPDPSRKISLLSRSSDYLTSLSSFLSLKFHEIRFSSWNLLTFRSFSYQTNEFPTKHSDSAEDKLLKSQLFDNFVGADEEQVLEPEKQKTKKQTLPKVFKTDKSKNVIKEKEEGEEKEMKGEVFDFASNNPRFNTQSKTEITRRKVKKAELSSKHLIDSKFKLEVLESDSKNLMKSGKKQTFRSPLPPGMQ